MKTSRPISFQLCHTPLMMGVMDKFNLAQLVDERVGKNGVNVQISSGSLLKILVCRYLSSDTPGGINSIESYVSSLPANFISPDACEDANVYKIVNRYCVGDLLDRIDEYGSARFSAEIISAMVDPSSITVANLDSTSYHFHGKAQYNEGLLEIEKSDDIVDFLPREPINIAFGYSRDNRPNDPQVNHLALSVRTALCSKPIVIYQAAFSGNMNDSKRFEKFCADGELKYLKERYKNMSTLVADSAAASAKTVKACKDVNIELVTRLKDNKVKKDFEAVRNGEISLNNLELPVPIWEKENTKPQNISYAWIGTDILKAKDGTQVEVQRILFVAESLRTIKTKANEAKAQKELQDVSSKLEKLNTKPRSCREDAKRDLEEIVKKLKLVSIDDVSYEEVLGYKGAGRPKANAQKVVTGVKVIAKASINEEALKNKIQSELYYVIATTDTSIEQTKKML